MTRTSPTHSNTTRHPYLFDDGLPGEVSDLCRSDQHYVHDDDHYQRQRYTFRGLRVRLVMSMWVGSVM